MNDEEKVINQFISKIHKIDRIEKIILFMKIVKHLKFYYHIDFNNNDLKELFKKYETILNNEKTIFEKEHDKISKHLDNLDKKIIKNLKQREFDIFNPLKGWKINGKPIEDNIPKCKTCRQELSLDLNGDYFCMRSVVAEEKHDDNHQSPLVTVNRKDLRNWKTLFTMFGYTKVANYIEEVYEIE